MFPRDNPQPPDQKQPIPHKPKRHNARFCSFAIRERIVNGLAAGDSQKSIARALHVSSNTVAAVAEQDWRQVEQRKARIAAQAERAATKAFDLLNQKLDSDGDKLTANQLVPIAGVSVDKLLLLRGDANIIQRVEHQFNAGNIFEAFRQFHNDALKIIKAREVGQQETLPALPDSPPAPDRPTP
jgi:hypothetical protein